MWLILFGGYFFGKMWKNMEKQPFSGRLWPDWGNTTWAAMAGLGSIGLNDLRFVMCLLHLSSWM